MPSPTEVPGPERAAETPEATRLLRDGDIDAAVTLWESRLETDPGDPAALAGLSRARTADGDAAAGLELARRALGRVAPPSSPPPGGALEARARLALGEASFRAGDLERAGIAFRRALRCDPGLAPAWYGLARVELTVPRYPEAGLLLLQAEALDPDDPRVVRRLAGLVASRERAKALYRHYLELPPAEGDQVAANARAWLAVLEAAGDRELFRLAPGTAAATLRLTRQQGRPLLDVRAGDLPARPFLLDSGAGGVTVTPDIVRRLDLEPVDAGYAVRGLSAEVATRPFVLLPALAVGPFVFHDVPAVVTDGGGARGILGMSTLAPLRPELDAFRTVRLRRDAGPPAGCPTGRWWRVRNVGGLLRLTARLDGRELHLLVDTGAARSVLSRAALRRLGVAESRATAATLRGLTGTPRDVGRVKKRAVLTFLGRDVSVRGLPVLDLSELSDSLGSEIDGILGVDLLEGRAAFDYAAGRLGAGDP